MISFIQKLVIIIQNLLPLIFAATNVKAKDIIHQVKGSKLKITFKYFRNLHVLRLNPVYSCPQRGPVEKKALPPTGIPRSKLRPAMASDKGAKLCSDGTYMVVATDVTAYQNPKKERPPFVPVEKKEVFNITRDSTILLTNLFSFRNLT